MAISVMLNFRTTGDALKMYDAVVDDMGLRGGSSPKGAIYHFAARTPDGMFVSDLWETREAFDTFARDQISPLSQKHGFSAPDIEYSDVHEMIDGGISANGGVGMVATFAGDTDELLRSIDEINRHIEAAKTPPSGLIIHASTKTPDGVRVVDHWRSRDDFERFLNGALGEALRAVGSPQPQIQFYDVYNVIDGRRIRV